MDPVRVAPAHSSTFVGHGDHAYAVEGGYSSPASYASYAGSAGYGGYAVNGSFSGVMGSLADGSGVVRGSASLDPDEHFRVVIRVRPPLERELNSPNWQNVVTVTDEIQVSLHEVLGEANAGDRASGTAQVVTNHAFTFDHVYDRDCSQPDVYSRTARASVLSTLQGYNATILAYGPTGTGKTYTMEGPRGEKIDGSYGSTCGSELCGGIIPRSMEEIFQHIRHCRGPQSRFLVRASYLQIYNEVISDLLKPDRSHLVIREDRRRGVFVEGLSEWLCRSPSEVRTLMERGSAARATAQTAANDASSRSHAVFIVIIEQSDTIPGMEGESERAAGPPDAADTGAHAPQQRVRVGRLNLVDLAGSERPRLTGATGQRLEETKKINQSLSALGNVIAALTERRARQHIPYRDSKLTRLLEDSLGGNCRTTMMAMVSPAAEAFAESLSTLKFAHRAKAIRNCAQVNEDVDQRTLLRRYEGELRRLRAELRERNRNVVDKRQLLELEEERRRAEEDRLAAVSALEERSLVLEQEKAQKQQLEERIRQMSSQLLVGGQQVEDTPQFRHAVAEQERIRMEYALKLTELERERSTIEEDKAQVSRYKQLLLKQRDIMMALTQRLHERDEAIIALQDEIHTRDRRLAELEDHLDRRGAQLLAAERRAALAGGIAAATAAPEGGKSSADGGPNASVAGHPGATIAAASATPSEPRYPPENAVFDLHSERPMQLLSASEKVAELMAFLDGMRQENHRLTLELEELQAERASGERAVLEHHRPPERQTPVHDPQVLMQPVVTQPHRLLEMTAGTAAAAEDAAMLQRLVAANAASSSPATLPAPVATAPNPWLGMLHPGGEAVAGLSGPIGGNTTASGTAAAAHAAEAMRAAAASQGFANSAASPGAELLSAAAAATAAANAAGRHIGSPLVHQRDGSVTPDGSLCGSTPRPSSASTRASATSNARGEHRGRRPPSLERGRSDDRPRSSSSRGDKPLTVRQGGAGSVSSSGSVRAASLGSSVGTTSTSLKSSARAGIGAWRGYSDVWPSPATAASANMLPTSAPGAGGLAPSFAEAFAESFSAAPSPTAESVARESSPWYAGAGSGSSRPSRRASGGSSAARTNASGSGSGGSAPPTPHGRHQRIHRDGAAGSLGPSPGPSPSPVPAVRNSFSGGLSASLGSNALSSALTAAAANAAATNGSLRRSVSAGRSSGVGSGLHGPGPVRAPPLPQFANWGNEAGVRPMASTPQTRALGAWLPPGLNTAVPGSPADSFGQPTAANNMGLAGSATTADALREEAQRSVDALLARRKAELRRSGSVPTAGAERM